MLIRRRIKRSTRQYIIVAFICITVIGGAAVFTAVTITGQIRQEYQKLLEDANKKLKDSQCEVFVAKKVIKVGDFITKNNVTKEKAFSSQPKGLYLTENGLGKTAVIEIPAGTQVINSMVTEAKVSSELRELEYNVIKLSSNVVNNDTVDIRICYPNGESYVVLSKKNIKDIAKDKLNCYFWLNEEEIVRMSSAIVDAYLYKGAQIYTTEYIEPNLQKESVVNYTPSLSIIQLIKTDPNIVKVASGYLNTIMRKEMENRLAESINQDVTQTNWQTDNNQVRDMQQDTRITKDATKANQSKSGMNHINTDETETNMDDNYYFQDETKDKEADKEYGE